MQPNAPTMYLIGYNISKALQPEVCDLEPTQEQWLLQRGLGYLPWLRPSATPAMTRAETLQLQTAATQTTSLAGGSLKEGDELEMEDVPSM